MSWAILDFGKVSSNIKVQDALTEQALLAYRQTVLTAMQDVENALIAFTKEQQRRESLTRAVVANRKAVEVATLLYTNGKTDFLNVLEAQRALYTSESSLVQSDENVGTDLIALYKALGGGWQESRLPNETPLQVGSLSCVPRRGHFSDHDPLKPAWRPKWPRLIRNRKDRILDGSSRRR